jgi:CubicO group peptidase (beta-lactamase class C family)
MSLRAKYLKDLLSESIARNGVPGASLAVWAEGELLEAAAGVTNADTKVEVTPDAIFQIGSITKPMTTSMAMQLVDEGKIELDAVVKKYLPELSLDGGVEGKVTVRQLMTHASGIDGDFFIDTGRGEDRVEKLVARSGEAGQLHEPGKGFSYCNIGFALLGRIIEKADGVNWDRAFRRRIAKRMGADSLVTLPEQCLRYRTAIGHFGDGKGGVRVTPAPYLAQSNGPAGATPTGRARDLITFARTHLAKGVAPSGEQFLSEKSVAQMQEPQNKLLKDMIPDSFGLAWMISDYGKERVYGHDGVTIGQNAFLRVLPEKKIAVALLTNGGDMRNLYYETYDAILSELANVMPPRPPAVSAKVSFDATKFAGKYEKRSATTIIGVKDGSLTISTMQHDKWAQEIVGDLGPFPLEPVRADTFLVPGIGSKISQTVVFFDFDKDGRPQAVFSGVRRFNRQN